MRSFLTLTFLLALAPLRLGNAHADERATAATRAKGPQAVKRPAQPRARRVFFHPGDVAQVVDQLPAEMRHFRGTGQRVLIHGSDFNQYGYSVIFSNGNESAWYPWHTLKLVQRANRATRAELHDWVKDD